LIDYEGFRDGQPFVETAKTENFTLKIGLGTMSEEFDKQLIGMQPEESKEITVKFPDDFHNEKLQDLEISFQVTLNEIREEILPPINDELAEKAGQKSLDDLKKVITDNLEQGYTKRKDQELQEQIYESLTSKSDFDVPDALVDMELEGIVNEAERSFAYRNITLEEMGLTKESIAEKYRDTAVSQVKRHLILGKMIEQEHLSLADDELEEELNEMATNFNQPVEEIKKFFAENKEKLESFKHAILEKKAIKLIIDSSEIEDVEPEMEPAAGDESEKVSENG
jgi:trigger factor